MMTKDGEGGREGQPKYDEGCRGGGGLKKPKLADIICEQPLIRVPQIVESCQSTEKVVQVSGLSSNFQKLIFSRSPKN